MKVIRCTHVSAAIHCYETCSKSQQTRPMSTPATALLSTIINSDIIANYKRLSQCNKEPLSIES
jgi:hypothetical protein